MKAYGINAWQGTRSVDCIQEASIALTVKHLGGVLFAADEEGCGPRQEYGSLSKDKAEAT